MAKVVAEPKSLHLGKGFDTPPILELDGLLIHMPCREAIRLTDAPKGEPS